MESLLGLIPSVLHLLGSGYSHKHLMGKDYQARHLHHVMSIKLAGQGLSHGGHHAHAHPAQRAHGGHHAHHDQKGGLVVLRTPRPRTRAPKRTGGSRSLNHMLADALR